LNGLLVGRKDILESSDSWIWLAIKVEAVSSGGASHEKRLSPESKNSELLIKSIGLYNSSNRQQCLFILVHGSSRGILEMQRVLIDDIFI
jgi:hypothetical protein